MADRAPARGFANAYAAARVGSMNLLASGHLWQPLTEGQGPTGAYLRGISDDQRIAVRNRLRQNVIGNRADGQFLLRAKAWAIRGVVP